MNSSAVCKKEALSSLFLLSVPFCPRLVEPSGTVALAAAEILLQHNVPRCLPRGGKAVLHQALKRRRIITRERYAQRVATARSRTGDRLSHEPDAEAAVARRFAEPERTPEHSKVLEAVLSLPQKYRIVTYLYYYEDYSVKEIAEITLQAPNTVAQQLARSRKKLRKKLEQEELL